MFTPDRGEQYMISGTPAADTTYHGCTLESITVDSGIGAGAILMLQDYDEAKKEISSIPKKTSSSNLIRFEFDNAGDTKEVYASLKRDGIRIFIDYAKTDYGKIEFGAYDPDGNMIIVSAPSN